MYQLQEKLCDNISHFQVNMMFDFADTDGDGQLSFGEFLKVINPPKPDKDGVVEEKKVMIEKENILHEDEGGEEKENPSGLVQGEVKDDEKVVKFVDEINNGNIDEKIKEEKEANDK